MAALLLAHVPAAHVTAPYAASFLLWTALVAALVMAWRFHSSRVVFAVMVLFLADRGVNMLPHSSPHSANIAFGLLALLVPLNLIFFSVIGESGLTLPSIGSGIGIISVQAIAIAVLARPENIEFARWSRHAYFPRELFAWTPLPQIALLVFTAAIAWLGMRMSLLRKPVDTAFFWESLAAFFAMNAAAPGGASSLYLATGVLTFAAALVETSYLLAFHDELTGLPGRRAFNQALLALEDAYSIAMVDVDHFKRFNDTFGHDTGDQVLRMVARRLAEVGGGGRAFRFGGEEFAIVFPGRSAADCLEHLEDVRQAIARSSFMVRGPDRSQRRRGERRYTKPGRRPVGRASTRTAVTVSMGVAECTVRLNTPEHVIEAADQALYRAKDNGRNRVERAGAVMRKNEAAAARN